MAIDSEKKTKAMWIIVLFLTLLFIGIMFYKDRQSTKIIENEIHKGLVQKTNFDRDFKELKDENRELYDSLKQYKDQIDFITQFDYSKEYNTDTVWITKKVFTKPEEKIKYIETIKKDTTIKTYEYANDKNDSINYKLKIGSTAEPNWYSLDMKVSDRFTIVNKKENGVNFTEVNSKNEGEITNVTAFNKKEKRIWNKIAIGPSITYGYDFNSKKFAPTVGISITYNIFGKQ